MKVIHNAHEINESYTKEHSNEYIILFGNSEFGWAVVKDELKKYWGIAIRNGQHQRVGDITLIFNGNWIRAGHNLEKKITNKNTQYPCFYRKNKVE